MLFFLFHLQIENDSQSVHYQRRRVAIPKTFLVTNLSLSLSRLGRFSWRSIGKPWWAKPFVITFSKLNRE